MAAAQPRQWSTAITAGTALGVVVAMIAILNWLFLPGQREDARLEMRIVSVQADLTAFQKEMSARLAAIPNVASIAAQLQIEMAERQGADEVSKQQRAEMARHVEDDTARLMALTERVAKLEAILGEVQARLDRPGHTYLKPSGHD